MKSSDLPRRAAGRYAIAANDSVSIQRSERVSLELFDDAQNASVATWHQFCAQIRPSERLRELSVPRLSSC